MNEGVRYDQDGHVVYEIRRMKEPPAVFIDRYPGVPWYRWYENNRTNMRNNKRKKKK